MKQLTWKLVLPLTIISFGLVTKWWFVEVNNEHFHEVLIGFPLPYSAPCWHTSMCSKYFIGELLLDVITYFLFCFIVTYVFHRFIKRIILKRLITVIIMIVSGIFLGIMILFFSLPDNVFYMERNFEIKTLDTGFKFHWEQLSSYDYYEMYPDTNENY